MKLYCCHHANKADGAMDNYIIAVLVRVLVWQCFKLDTLVLYSALSDALVTLVTKSKGFPVN